jgi:precorrin-4 methylase
MNLTKSSASIGLFATATPTAPGATGKVNLGAPAETVNLPDGQIQYDVVAVFAAAAANLVLDLSINSTTGSTAWVAGVAQVKTATAAGSVTANGNCSVIITAAGMIGSPKTFNVPVLAGDTPSVWAGKVRTALAADFYVSEMFTVSGAGTSIVLTRKPLATYKVPGGTLNLYAANDATLNIALATGTATGITAAPTAASTTAGVASAGVKIYGGAGKDFEGNALDSINGIYGLLLRSEEVAITADGSGTDLFRVNSGESFLKVSASELLLDTSYTFTSGSRGKLSITVLAGGF